MRSVTLVNSELLQELAELKYVAELELPLTTIPKLAQYAKQPALAISFGDI